MVTVTEEPDAMKIIMIRKLTGVEYKRSQVKDDG